MRIAAGIPVALLVALAAGPARAQECTDASCQIDLSVDECAIRHASRRTHAEHGLGLYFIGRSDITPSSRYTVADMGASIHHAMLRFR